MAATLGLSGAAHAQLSINRLWVDLDAGAAPRADLVIRNDSEDRYYISVQTSEISAPGTPEEARVEAADPEKVGLLVTPNRIVLEPGASRSIRVVSLNENLTQDRVYRVLIRPQVGEVKTAAAEKDVRDVAIKILSAYEVLIVARPRSAEAKVNAVRQADRITFSNTGNSNVLLLDAFICPPNVTGLAPNDSCKPFPATRLYASTSVDIPLEKPDEIVIVRERKSADSEPVSVRY